MCFLLEADWVAVGMVGKVVAKETKADYCSKRIYSIPP